MVENIPENLEASNTGNRFTEEDKQPKAAFEEAIGMSFDVYLENLERAKKYYPEVAQKFNELLSAIAGEEAEIAGLAFSVGFTSLVYLMGMQGMSIDPEGDISEDLPSIINESSAVLWAYVKDMVSGNLAIFLESRASIVPRLVDLPNPPERNPEDESK